MPLTDVVDSRLTSNIEGYLFGTATSVELYNTLELQGFGHILGYRYSARITQLRVIGASAAIEWWVQLRSGRRITIAETQQWNQAETLEGLVAAELIIGYGSKFGASIREPLPEGRSIDIVGVAEEQGWPGYSGQDSPSSWGAIFGEISDQADLMGALGTKASKVELAEYQAGRVSAVEAIDAEINRIDSLILALTARVDTIEFELTPAIDPDFSAFIAAAGISSAAQVGAVEALVTGFKADGIWQLMQAIFPFVGGTDDSHKWNLKDPATYQLVFAPGTTHDNLKGMLQPNPGTSVATSASVSGFTVADIDVSDYSMGVYYKGSLRSRPPNNRPDIVVGSATPADMAPWMLSGIFRNEDNLVYGVHGSFSPFLSSSPTQGLNVLSSLGNSQFQYHKNGVQVAVQNRSGAVKPATGGGAEIGCNSLDGTTFAFLGRGLTDAQHSQLNARVAAFQIALGRAV